jgi:hypothetical protein
MLIYSASPLIAFTNTFIEAGVVVGIGIVALVYAFIKRKQGRRSILGMIIAGAFLAGMGLLMLGVTAKNMVTSTQTTTGRLNQKTVAQDNCNDGGTCTRYVLGMTAGAKSYDFTVGAQTFAATHKGTCYQVTYYPNQSLFATDNSTDLYVATSYVTRIAEAGQDACQP